MNHLDERPHIATCLLKVTRRPLISFRWSVQNNFIQICSFFIFISSFPWLQSASVQWSHTIQHITEKMHFKGRFFPEGHGQCFSKHCIYEQCDGVIFAINELFLWCECQKVHLEYLRVRHALLLLFRWQNLETLPCISNKAFVLFWCRGSSVIIYIYYSYVFYWGGAWFMNHCMISDDFYCNNASGCILLDLISRNLIWKHTHGV